MKSPEQVIKERYSRLHEHLNSVSLSVNEEIIGQEREVLVTDIEGSRATGKSEDFRLVHFDSSKCDARPGDLVRVRIDAAKPHFIFSNTDPIRLRKTRGGDAFEARKREADRKTGTRHRKTEIATIAAAHHDKAYSEQA